MAENVEIIADYLRADATLLGTFDALSNSWSGLARGGIWTRKIKRFGAGNTPQAFTAHDDKASMIKPSISIRDMGDTRHRQEDAIPTAYNQFIWIYFYAPALASGKEAVKDMRRRVYELLDFTYSGWRFTTEDGTLARLELVDRRGRHDSETFKEAVEDYQRYQITSRYADIT